MAKFNFNLGRLHRGFEHNVDVAVRDLLGNYGFVVIRIVGAFGSRKGQDDVVRSIAGERAQTCQPQRGPARNPVQLQRRQRGVGTD